MISRFRCVRLTTPPRRGLALARARRSAHERQHPHQRRDSGTKTPLCPAAWRLLFVAVRRAEGLARVAEEQVGANERIDVAIENFLHVAARELGSVVLDHLIWLHDVRANLAAEADLRF